MADAAQSQAIEWGSAEAANLSWLDELSASLLSADSSSSSVGVGGGGGHTSSSLALGSTSASTSTAAAASSTIAPHAPATLPRESESTHGAADAVIATLLAQRAALDDALLANASLQKDMLAAVKGARGARAELRELVPRLQYASEVALEDAQTPRVVLDANVAPPQWPYFRGACEKIPLLRQHFQRLIEFRGVASSSPPWSVKDIARLRELVLGACKRALCLRLLARGTADPLGVVEGMPDVELALAALPRLADADADASSERQGAEGEETSVDWKDIGERMQRTEEDCRTRWMHHDRPGLRIKEKWSAQEMEQLFHVTSALREEEGGAALNWDVVASRLDNGRLPFECLQTYARHEEARSRKKAATAQQQQQQQQLGYTWQDDRAILKLMRIWGRWWTIIAGRAATNRLASHVQAHHHDSLRLTAPRLTWEQVDSALCAAVAAQLQEAEAALLAAASADDSSSSSAVVIARSTPPLPQDAAAIETIESLSANSKPSRESATHLLIEQQAARIDWRHIAKVCPQRTPEACEKRWKGMQLRLREASASSAAAAKRAQEEKKNEVQEMTMSPAEEQLAIVPSSRKRAGRQAQAAAARAVQDGAIEAAAPCTREAREANTRSTTAATMAPLQATPPAMMPDAQHAAPKQSLALLAAKPRKRAGKASQQSVSSAAVVVVASTAPAASTAAPAAAAAAEEEGEPFTSAEPDIIVVDDEQRQQQQPQDTTSSSSSSSSSSSVVGVPAKHRRATPRASAAPARSAAAAAAAAAASASRVPAQPQVVSPPRPAAATAAASLSPSLRSMQAQEEAQAPAPHADAEPRSQSGAQATTTTRTTRTTTTTTTRRSSARRRPGARAFEPMLLGLARSAGADAVALEENTDAQRATKRTKR